MFKKCINFRIVKILINPLTPQFLISLRNWQNVHENNKYSLFRFLIFSPETENTEKTA